MGSLLLTEGTIIFLSTLVFILLFRVIPQKRRIPKGLRLPPGPPGKFIFGNVADMPTHHHWEAFRKLGESYGNLVHLQVLNTNIIVINSADIAHDLFEKRSLTYSDRMDLPMLNDLMGSDWNFGLMRYGDMWRRHRKGFEQKFHQTAAATYQGIQTKQTRKFLSKLYESPDDFTRHIRHLSGAIIMEISYGIHVLPENDPYIRTAEIVAAATAEAGAAGAFLVDVFPVLKYVPAWFPGASFRRKAHAWRIPITQMATAPFETVKTSWAAGTAAPSVLLSMLEDLSNRFKAPPDEETVVRNVAAAAYIGGADTVVSAMSTFFLAMVLYPDVQRKAREELDTVIGMDRLPDFEDREDLPYVDALCKEVLRWHPVLPICVPHRSTHDDVYGDFFIPRGSLVLGNSWSMLRDEKMFGPEPEKFIPDRFLRPGVKAPIFAFGFGRRICPGRHLASNSIFIAVASILKAFEIKHAVGNNGEKIPVDEDFTSGLMSAPEPFQCNIKLRSGVSESVMSEL